MLSDFSGTVPSQWARLDFDQKHKEVYTFNKGENEVRIFNEKGMEIFSFGEDSQIGSASDIAVGETGDIYLLSRGNGSSKIEVLNYRGEPAGSIAIQNVPVQFAGFNADRLECKNGSFYLVNSRTAQVMVVSTSGEFSQIYDISSQLEELAEEQDPERKRTQELEIGGFSIDNQGAMYFTVPVLFAAFKLNSSGDLESFGRSGSGPGKFGVVSGIVVDSAGNIYVADRLRSVVMVFGNDFEFQGEFGYRGGRPDNLIVPDDLVVDETDGKVYVAQAANRGVGVYKVHFGEPK